MPVHKSPTAVAHSPSPDPSRALALAAAHSAPRLKKPSRRRPRKNISIQLPAVHFDFGERDRSELSRDAQPDVARFLTPELGDPRTPVGKCRVAHSDFLEVDAVVRELEQKR